MNLKRKSSERRNAQTSVRVSSFDPRSRSKFSRLTTHRNQSHSRRQMYSPNRRKCQPICKYGIVWPSCSRANSGNSLSRNEHSVASHLFFPIRFAIRGARIQEKPVRAIIFLPSGHIRDGRFYRAKITSIASSTSRLRRSSRHSYSR